MEVDELEAFPTDAVGTVNVTQAGLVLRRLIGRGPLTYELPASMDVYFEHGSAEYPTFECPSVGPRGAGLKGRKQVRTVDVDESETLFLLEVTVANGVGADPEEWWAQYKQESQPSGGCVEPVGGKAFEQASAGLSMARELLNRVVGCYALYQYPLVWEQLARSHVVICVSPHSGMAISKSPEQPDNFIPFRLRLGSHLRGETIVDAVTQNLDAIAQLKTYVPLVFLQESLWANDIRTRFLLQFWIIEHLAWARAEGLPKEQGVRACAKAVEAFLAREHPDYLEHFKARKGEFVALTLMQAVERYAEATGVSVEVDEVRRAKRIRDAMSHGQSYADSDLRHAEMHVRQLVRKMLRQELEAQGIQLVAPEES